MRFQSRARAPTPKSLGGGIRHPLDCQPPPGYSWRGNGNGHNHIPSKTGRSKEGTLPHHLWPKSVHHDIDNIRRRLKILIRLASLTARDPEGVISDTSSHLTLWQEVLTPLPLCTDLSPPPRDHASLDLLHREDLVIADDTSPSKLQSSFKGLRRATRPLIRNARNLRRLRYGKALLCLFVKKPSAALKSILRTSEGKKDTNIFPHISP
jgi:hypothetical protein